jgi:hypothetical protein
MHGIDRDGRATKPPRQLVGEQEVRQLRLVVRLEATVPSAPPLQVVPAQSSRQVVPGRRHVDNPRRTGAAHDVQKQRRQEKGSQVIQRQGQLDAIHTLPAVHEQATRVVDQHVNGLITLPDAACEPAHLRL